MAAIGSSPALRPVVTPVTDKLGKRKDHSHKRAKITPSSVEVEEDGFVDASEMSAVVKVYATCSAPDYWMPWQNKASQEATGSGFVIQGKRIITNAHVVADQKFVMVRKHGIMEIYGVVVTFYIGSPDRFQAKVVAVGHDCDLAMLMVEDEAFFENIEPLVLGDIPHLEEEVSVIGFPTGGDNISVTKGVVSRVELQQYEHGSTNLLAIQIDAAINPGNSGGPAVQGEKVVGVAFQSMTEVENMGFIIPVPIIHHFLKDITPANGGLHGVATYSGFCSLGLRCQTMENAQLRKFKKMGNQTGILVTKVNKLSPSAEHILAGDVILSVDGHVVANDGTILFRARDRIAFDYVISLKHKNETVEMKLMRDGHVKTDKVPVALPLSLVPSHQYDAPPSYFVIAGLVFVPLTKPYLEEWGEAWFNECPRKLCDRSVLGEIQSSDQQVIVLSQVLAHRVTVGYTDLSNQILTKVNDVAVNNLSKLIELVSGIQEGPVVFHLEDSRLIVMDSKEAHIATKEILQMNRIPNDRFLK